MKYRWECPPCFQISASVRIPVYEHVSANWYSRLYQDRIPGKLSHSQSNFSNVPKHLERFNAHNQWFTSKIGAHRGILETTRNLLSLYKISFIDGSSLTLVAGTIESQYISTCRTVLRSAPLVPWLTWQLMLSHYLINDVRITTGSKAPGTRYQLGSDALSKENTRKKKRHTL